MKLLAATQRGSYWLESITVKGATSVGTDTVKDIRPARVESHSNFHGMKVKRMPSKLVMSICASITLYIVANILGFPRRTSKVGNLFCTAKYEMSVLVQQS